MRSLIRRVRIPMVVASALLALTMGVGAAAAASPDANTTSTFTTNHDLQRGMRSREAQLQGAATQITMERQYAASVAMAIAALKGQGLDVTDLMNGLAKFDNRIAFSQAAWQNASDTLSMHGGFDAQGNVVDKGQAEWTLNTAHDQLMQIKQSATTSKNELHDLFTRFDRITGAHVDVASTRNAF